MDLSLLNGAISSQLSLKLIKEIWKNRPSCVQHHQHQNCLQYLMHPVKSEIKCIVVSKWMLKNRSGIKIRADIKSIAADDLLGKNRPWLFSLTCSTFFSLIQVLTDHLWISASASPWCSDTSSLPSRCFECWNRTYLDLDAQVSSTNVAHSNSWTSANWTIYG